MKLHLGCGRNILPGWVNIDSMDLPGVDKVCDIGREALPFGENEVEEFLLSHVIEHIPTPLFVMQEAWRVAKPDAKMVIRTPYGSSDDAWEDPTHVRPYFVNSFGYFSQPCYWRADYGYRGDWQVRMVHLIVSKQKCEGLNPQQCLERISRERNWVNEMVAELFAVKPLRESRKELIELPKLNIVPV